MSPTPKATPYQAIFSSVGTFAGVDPIPLSTGRVYKVDWSYDATDGPCAFAAALATPGNVPSPIMIADEAAQGGIRTGKETITWTGTEAEPRLNVASGCLWVITFAEVR